LRLGMEFRWRLFENGANRRLEVGVVENGVDVLTAAEKAQVAPVLAALPRPASVSADAGRIP
jgi:hypothetical protein